MIRRLASGVIVVLVAAACGAPGPQLTALQEEAARLDGVDGLRLVQEREQNQKEGLPGKPSRARVTRTYLLERHEPAEDAARALVERAVAEGWEMASEPSEVLGGLAWRGVKPVDGVEVTLTISLITDPAVAPRDLQPPVLYLDLVHPFRTS